MKNKLFLILSIILVFVSCKPDFKNIIGVGNIEIEENLYSKSTGGLNGEGYDFNIFKLSKNTIDNFVKNDKRNKYPININEENNYKIINWTATPFNEDDVLELVFSNYSEDLVEEEYLKKLKLVLSSDNNFYCYYYKKRGGVINDIKFYVIDVKENILYSFENIV